MGINRNGRFAAVTNYRKFPLEGPFSTSRGDLVKDFLTSDISPDIYLEKLRSEGGKYEGYNLLFGNADAMYYHSNRGAESKLTSDIYGISNHLLDTPWPKVSKGKKAFREKVMGSGKFEKEDLFAILKDEEKARDEDLPDTGIGLEKERLLSSIFIKSPEYGTRISTVLSIDDGGGVKYCEQSHLPSASQDFAFQV